MFNAEDARRLSDQKIEETYKQEMFCISTMIKNACEEGEYRIHTPKGISSNCLTELKNLGYVIECDQRDGIYAISW